MPRLLLAAAAALLAGCDRGPATYRVVGTVTWKGEPVADGRINLIAADGQSQPATAKITAGKFELRSAPGVKRVEVLNQKDMGFNKVMNQRTYANEIPVEYNAESRLKFDVQPHDDNVLDLTLPQK